MIDTPPRRDTVISVLGAPEERRRVRETGQFMLFLLACVSVVGAAYVALPRF